MAAATIAPLVAGDGDRYPALLAGLALIVGVILIAAGIARLGFISDFLARPVLTGFISGLALVIGVGQVDKLFGIEAEGENFFQQVWDIVIHLGDTHLETFLVGAGCLALLFGLKRFAPRTPAALITVAASIIAVTVFDLEDRGVHVAGDIPAGLPPLALPGIDFGDALDLLPGAIALALVAYAESIAGARKFAVAKKYEVDPNQELIALGAANVGAGLSKAFVVNVSLSRSAVAVDAGQRSQVAGLFNAGLMLITMIALTPLFHDLPEAALAAVVIAAVAHLIDPSEFMRLYRIHRTDFILALVCLFGVLVLDVLPGLLVAVAVSIAALVYRASRPNTAVLGRAAGEESYRDVARNPEAETVPGLLVFRFDAELFFANANYFKDRVRELIRSAEPPVTGLLIDAEAILDLDTSATDMLGELRTELADSDVELLLARVHGPVRDMLRKSGLEDAIGTDRLYPTVRAGVDDFLARHPDAAGGTSTHE